MPRGAIALLLVVLTPSVATADFVWSGKLESEAAGLADPRKEKRLSAIQQLSTYPIARSQAHLLSALSDMYPDVRVAAAWVLARAHIEAAAEPVTAWLSSPEKTTRVSAAWILGELGSLKAVPALTRALVDTEADVRKSAVEALGRIGGPDAALPVIGRLDDDSVQVRRAATEALATLADPRAVIPLLERFGDSSKEVRVAAIQAVGRLADPRVIPALLRLARDPLEDLSIAAVESLGNLHAGDATTVLVPMLYRGSDEKRAKVAFALGQIGGREAVRALVLALGNEALRPAAREALHKVGQEAIPQLLACLGGDFEDCDVTTAVLLCKDLANPQSTPLLIRELERRRVKPELVISALGASRDPRAQEPLLALLEDRDVSVRRAALQEVHAILDGRAAEVLIHVLKDADSELRRMAASYLGTLRSRAAVPSLLALTQGTGPADVRLSAIQSLGQIGDPRATSALVSLLPDANHDLQRAASDALALLADAESVPRLLELFSHPEPTTRLAAVKAVGGVLRGRRHATARQLLEKLATPNDTVLTLEAIDALAAMNDPGSLETLLALARDAPRAIRRAAIEVLGNSGDPRVLPLLLSSLEHTDDGMRGAAAWALGKLGDPRALPSLLKATRDRSFATAINASAGLARLGQPVPQADVQALLSHTSPYVRANAALILGRLPRTAKPDLLVKLFEKDANPYVRSAAARALAAQGMAGDVLRAFAQKDKDAEVRRAVEDALTHTSLNRDRNLWIHLYWTNEDGEPIPHDRYVVIAPDGVVKAGYTDVRGEAAEEQFPTGVWSYEFLDEEGKPQATKGD
jgi:HEAT repeat protein